MRKKRNKNFYLLLILGVVFVLLFVFTGKEKKEEIEIAPKEIITQSENFKNLSTEKSKGEEKKSKIEEVREKPVYKKEIKNYNRALVAIVVDDMGLGREIEKEVLKIKYPLTISLLPVKDNNRININKNFQIILHQPMEPENPETDPGSGKITTEMTEEEIKKQLQKNLEKVPQAVGINNHMGSLATSKKEVMSAVLDVVKERNLFFLDSKTSANSCGYSLAKYLNIPAIQRDVFLDGVKEKNYIKNQFLLLEKIAIKKGYAVGIIHPHRESISVLKEMLPEMEKKGIKFVHVSELVR